MTESDQEVYLGLGGNVGDSCTTLQSALRACAALPNVHNVYSAPLYLTSPVSSIPQGLYINTVCCLRTSLDYRVLLQHLQRIEQGFGKDASQAKSAPRTLDIDILFYGKETVNNEDLVIPHPRWQERLFVLVPLADLTVFMELPDGSLVDIRKRIEEVCMQEDQWVWQLDKPNLEVASV